MVDIVSGGPMDKADPVMAISVGWFGTINRIMVSHHLELPVMVQCQFGNRIL